MRVRKSRRKNIKKEIENGAKLEGLALVTVWALFGIELISRHAKNVVALNTDAVNISLRRLGGV